MSQPEPPDLSAFVAVEALVDCPGTQGLYTYRIPKDFTVESGDIVSVPFGGRQLGAIAIRLLSIASTSMLDYKLRNVESIVSRGFFSKDYWKILERVANYYQTSLIQVIRTALPPGLLGRSQRRIRLKSTARALSPHPPLSASAQTLLDVLQGSPQGDYTWRYLQRQHPQARAGLKMLLSYGWVESYLAIPAVPRPQQRQAVSLTASSVSSTDTLTQRQQEILITLQRYGGDLWLSDALQRLQTTSATLQRLAAKGYLAIAPRERLRVGSHSQAAADRPKSLTPDQQQALTVLNGLTGYAEVLLHGVTGSGKTEVYLQAIVQRLQVGKSVLVLVPEIGLTPQLTDRFRARFGTQVCVYHSGLSEGERYDTWRQMLAGQPQVVIGTRSAIFSPLPRLGMIVLDEEHDGSFKQDQPAPCYHARTVARWRAQMADCPLVLGSATPALDTWVAVTETRDRNTVEAFHGTPLHDRGTTHYLSLPHRVHQRPLPPVNVVDMRLELQAGNRSVFSRPLQTALEKMQHRGEQGLLFIHRRGHSRFVSCRSCGHVMECPDCDVSLAYHQPQDNGPAHLRCHYCGYGQRHPDQCPSCKSPYLKHFGSGTQRIVHELQSQFPGLSCLRFDSDTTRAKGAHRALLERFAAGEADVLVGTQMLTKGIDLPQITVVGVVAADGLLHMPDYWSGERAFQTLTQVAGRAGRGEHPGQVILQTYTPDHPVIGAAKTHNYQAFIDHETEHRQLLGYPPYGRLVLLRLSSPVEAETERAAQRCAEQLQVLIASPGGKADSEMAEPSWLDASGPTVLGPTPAPVYRVARRYRWHVLLKLPLAGSVPDLKILRSHLPKSVRLTIDIDPLNLS
ncbi:primosomal protein N' [Leptolyngbya cf. ectocarpi LEGE 11479]|uniref:Replication restart protein PriA n=1 Tax=Leptolyngbya cf. ectocarpi LEGE 11479 TaxID=1828722 RepID=A0A928ZTB4_LEPEC|nr:primosomal protein N' [Leptolyngbya ectocarpi]MBE9066911.1 primosomal protein N' [Leptolyngbya cf. ectocarpi LEGE 11479]